VDAGRMVLFAKLRPSTTETEARLLLFRAPAWMLALRVVNIHVSVFFACGPQKL